MCVEVELTQASRVSQIRQQQTTHIAQKSPQSQTPAQPQPSPGPATDVFAYSTGPSPASHATAARETAIPMSETAQWPVQTQTQVPIDPATTAPVGADWAFDPNGSNVMRWGERNETEYWLPDSLDAQVPIFEFPGTNVYLRPSLPSIVQTESDLPTKSEPPHTSNIALSNLTPHSQEDTKPWSVWPSAIIEANMIPWIDVYFDRLHPTLPMLNRPSLFTRMLSQEHRRNHQFGAMLLSLCAFSLTQPIEIDERPTSSSRAGQARSMMREATKMRSCSDFGEHPTIEAILTSFFLFGCLFGSNQHNAAWLRLREALDLAATLGLNDPSCYTDLSSDEKGQRLRTYLVLSITER